MQEDKKTNYLKGAAILAAASVFAKIVGAIYKIPLFQDGVLGLDGAADFQTTYRVYALILTISTAGIPAALSRLVSSAKAKGDVTLVRRYFSVAMPGFIIIGLITMLVMFVFAEQFAAAMGNSKAAPGIRVLSPAVFFVCIISVYRGYAQGFQDMLPTAISQIVEVLSKAIFGIAAALWLVSLGFESHIVSAGAIVGVTIGLGLCIPLLYRQKKKLDTTAHIAAPKDEAETPRVLKATDIFSSIMKVSIPITLTASFMSIMALIDTGIVLRRLQSALGMTEEGARVLFGMLSRSETLYNLTPALLVPISVSIIPAIAAALAVKRSDEAKAIMQSSVKLVNLIAMPAAAGLMVLASPVLTALYNDKSETAAMSMLILGAASFFVCLQYVTTSILQANGFERISLITFPVGAAVKILLAWILVGLPEVNVLASPIGTLVGFFVISVLNIIFIMAKIKDNRPRFLKVFAGPALCSGVMAGIALGIYELLSQNLAGRVAGARLEAIAFLSGAVIVGVVSYGILIIFTRTVTMEDMKLLPKGEQIGRFLRVKQ